jgi:tetratricopeptide (TPR) repeat protein
MNMRNRNKTFIGRVLPFVCLWLLQSCAGTNLNAPVAETSALPAEIFFGDTTRFGPRPALVDDVALHQLTAEQQQAFWLWFDHPLRADKPPHKRLFDYLEEITANFRYDDRTLPATDTLRLRSGNCLSLAILTTALARLAGVDIAYQLMNDEPVFEVGDQVVKKGLHVRTVLSPPPPAEGEGEAVLLPARLVIDYFPTGRERFVANLDTAGYLSLYHGNMAAVALERRDLGVAYWEAREALNLAPQDAAALNLLAVVHKHAGDAATAEAIYRYAIAHANDRLSLLKNYQGLLQEAGRLTEAEAIGRQLESLDDPSPVHWYLLAREAADAGDLDAAIRYYGKALERAPYLHEAYLGQALAYYRSGQSDLAAVALHKALETAQTVSTRKLYQAKLMTLSGER